MAQKIKRLELKPSGKVFIELNKSNSSKNATGVVNKNSKETSDLMPHGDLLRALEKLTPHLLIAMELADPTYTLIDKDYPMDKKYFDSWEWKEDPRFEGLTVTGILVVGKEAVDGIYLLGTKETSLGGISKLKTPLISLVKEVESENYPLQLIIDAQIETLISEALEYHNELKFAPDPQGKLWEDATAQGGQLKKVS